MAPDHDRLREWAGAYALGALDSHDRREFESHLRSCRDCQAEVGQFAAIPAVLERIDADEILAEPDQATAVAIEARARAELRGLVTSRRRWRWFAIGAAAACVAAMAAVVWPASGDDTIELSISGSQIDAASIHAEEKGWGTELHAELGGLPDRESYRLWTVDASGTWVVAASWGPTPSGGAAVTGASSTPVHAISRILVTSDDRGEVLVDASLPDPHP